MSTAWPEVYPGKPPETYISYGNSKAKIKGKKDRKNDDRKNKKNK